MQRPRKKPQYFIWPIFLTLLISIAAAPGSDEPAGNRTLQDEFLDKLVGRWSLTRKVRDKTEQNKVETNWVLGHQFVRIHMTDVASPPKYEADVYIGYDTGGKRYVAHWMDTWGGGFSLMGFGVRDGNSLPLLFEDAEATVRNTFTYDPTTDTWTSLIVQKKKGGDWKPFAEDRLQRQK